MAEKQTPLRVKISPLCALTGISHFGDILAKNGVVFLYWCDRLKNLVILPKSLFSGLNWGMKENMRNNWFMRINLFSTGLISLSIICGIGSSIWLGFEIHKQAAPNFNKRSVILEIEKKLDAISALSSENDLSIQQDISSYNRKIVYARLLKQLKPQDFSKIQNPELVKLKDNYAAAASKSFAVQEYGVVIIILAAVFSTGLTIPVFWLLFCTIAFVFSLLTMTEHSFVNKDAL